MQPVTLAVFITAGITGNAGTMMLSGYFLPYRPYLGVILSVTACVALAIYMALGDDADEPHDGQP